MRIFALAWLRIHVKKNVLLHIIGPDTGAPQKYSVWVIEIGQIKLLSTKNNLKFSRLWYMYVYQNPPKSH